MVETIRKNHSVEFVWQITLGNIITVSIMVVTLIAGYVRLSTNHENLSNLFRDHAQYDDARFAQLTSKEQWVQRNREVDTRLQEINNKLDQIITLHLENKNGKPK